MTSKTAAIVAAAAALGSASPAFAAEDVRDPGQAGQRTAAFAGASLRLGLDGRSAGRADARLHAGFVRRSPASAYAVPRFGGLAIGAGGAGKPAFYLGGTELGRSRDRFGMSTGTAIAVGAGVVVLAVVAVAAAASPPDIGCSLSDEGC